MATLFTSAGFFERAAEELARIERDTGRSIERIPVPAEPLDEAALARLEIAFFAADVIGGPDGMARRFFGSVRRAPDLRWLHVAHAGVDAPVYAELVGRAGLRVTTSSGDAAQSIAQTAIAGLLMLARGFPRWLDAQHRHAWERHDPTALPRDLAGQTLVVVGVGAIGNELARLGRALGLHVIGVRRSPLRDGDHVDAMEPPSALPALYPRADWLALACPLTDDTRGLIDAGALDALPRGACVLNVARGEVIDEAALIEGLRSGHLGGAYLDVVQQEPLTADSPLWELPNVIVTPHDSSASAGYRSRTDARFLANLERYLRDEPLEQVVGTP